MNGSPCYFQSLKAAGKRGVALNDFFAYLFYHDSANGGNPGVSGQALTHLQNAGLLPPFAVADVEVWVHATWPALYPFEAPPGTLGEIRELSAPLVPEVRVVTPQFIVFLSYLVQVLFYPPNSIDILVI
jgi:hypothetical protein